MDKSRFKYRDLIMEVATKKRKYFVLDFKTREEMQTGYNSIRVFIIRNNLQNVVFTSMRSNGFDEVHRIVVADTKRRDLLYQDGKMCA